MRTPEELIALRSRALERAWALTDSWTNDHTPTTRAAAAEIFAQVLELDGWQQTTPPPAPLRLVTEHCVHSAAIHQQHHTSPVTGCPWCTEPTVHDVPTGGAL